VPEPVSIELNISGLRAVIEADRWYPGSYRLIVDGTPQSHVHPEQPTELYFEYVRRIGHVIDELRPAGDAITAVHFGAGAFTLPRYIEATRPGSRQQVVELERDLVDFVREHLPLPKDASIRIRYGDAREVAGRLPAGLQGNADLVVVDIFSGARTPGHVTSIEFYSEVIRLLKPDGIVAVNVADGPGMSFARSQAATLQYALPHVAVLAEAQVLKGRRYGNFVLIGSPTELPLEWMPRLLAAGPHPSRIVHGSELRDWIAGAPVVTDATAVPSPPPGRTIFQVGRGKA
jgi:hypothetical protein